MLGAVQLRVEKERITDGEQVKAMLKEELVATLRTGGEKGRIWGEEDEPPPGRPAVILVVGVNGTGKTLSGYCRLSLPRGR